MKSAIVLFAVGTLVVGCAKKREYKEIYKDSTFSKTLLSSDPNDPYVYVPSVENTPMNVTASRPYWLGDQKLVVFKFKERSLEVLEVPSDKRFYQNENNFSPVFKLDITHKDFRCAEDQFGECSNKEEEVDNATWGSKKFFKADFSKLTVLETNSLPEQLTNLFQKCFSDKGSEVKSLKIDQDSLNITVERTLTADIECADVESFDDLRNLTFKVNYHYSFIKLSRLASQNYRPVVYPYEDQNTFGFFTTTQKKLSADNRTTLNSEVTFMNRWNPEAQEIVYNLNDSFYDEGMEAIKESTIKAVDAVNSSFTRAGVNMKIRLADGRGKAVGDLRNNFLVLVKDPQASGVIGYGPTVANPHTGEIMKGQVIMYYGTIRKYIQETYDELVEEQRTKAANAQTPAAAVESKVAANGQLQVSLAEEMARSTTAAKNMNLQLLRAFNIEDAVKTQTAAPFRQEIAVVNNSKFAAKIKSEIFSHDRVMKTYSLEDSVEEMSRHNMYHESMVNWSGALDAAMAEGNLDLKDAKPWNDLSEEEKDVIINKLMPYVWIPTLVHELGHNLGLRHNFNGSEDKDNYYSHEEGGKLGIGRDVTYSSVMDYSYSSLNQLPVMGKYDIAALAFGYNREVQLKDGQVVKMSKASLEEMKKDGSIDKLKEFKYCTDEHASVNPGCNRFDEGSTLEEMARHYVKAYKKNYEKRNKRNNRLNFSSINDGEYYAGVRNTFSELRIFFEVFDRIKGMYPALKPEIWESNAFLKDLKAAATVAAEFYVEILKTPSVHCAIVDKAANRLAAVLPIENLSRDAVSCFDSEVEVDESKYVVIGQTGKHLNHARGSKLPGELKADPTQLDTRGIWADKVLAMDYLTKRELGISTFDDYRSSFLDHPEFKAKIMEAFLGFMGDKIDLKTEIEMASGKKVPFEHTFEVGATHNITRSFSRSLSKYLGLNKASTDIRELLFPMVKKNLQTSDDETATLGLLQGISAVKVEPTTYLNPSEVALQVDLKDAEGRNGARFAATNANLMAKDLMEKRDLRSKLDKVARAELIKVYQAKSQGQPDPAEIPEALKLAYSLELEKLEAYLVGALPEDTLVQKLLTIMSK